MQLAADMGHAQAATDLPEYQHEAMLETIQHYRQRTPTDDPLPATGIWRTQIDEHTADPHGLQSSITLTHLGTDLTFAIHLGDADRNAVATTAAVAVAVAVVGGGCETYPYWCVSL